MKRAVLLLLAAFALRAPVARATTYVMMSDAALADRTPAIALVRVVAVEPAPAAGMPSTDYLVEVEHLVKGFVPGSTLVVRVPGGPGTDGIGLKIWGAPAFRKGEQALLFLAPHAEDGTFRIFQLMLGAFHVRDQGGRRLVLRDLSEAQELAPAAGAAGRPTLQAGSDRARDLAGFMGWLEDRAADRPRAADYLVAPPAGALEGNFVLLTPPDGIPIRWFRFDTGQSVRWRVNQSGQPGLTLDQTVAAFRIAIDAWNSDAGSNVNYVYDGTTTAGNGLGHSDDTNAILFDDPRDQVSGNFDCTTGGVLAAGGPFFFNSTRDFHGTRYHEAVEGDIVTNDGTGCFFADAPKLAEEIFGHELGHTLGLGHSHERQALMFATAHADGRGASLTSDDREGIDTLYGNGAPPPPPPPPPPGLKAPTNLVGQVLSSTQVKLTWQDNSTVEDQMLVERKRIGGSWRQVMALPANTKTATVSSLTPGTAYAFRVRAKKGAAFSDYSNTIRPPKLPLH